MRSLAEMADTLVEDYDVVDLLTGLADRCVELFGVSAAGVMLASPEGRLGLLASSSEAMRLLELFELQAQEGPCLDAFRTGERVEHQDLEAESGRWPSFSTAALREGFQSVSALPLRFRDITLGALNLFSVTQAPMSEADVTVARAPTVIKGVLAVLALHPHRVVWPLYPRQNRRGWNQRRPHRKNDPFRNSPRAANQPDAVLQLPRIPEVHFRNAPDAFHEDIRGRNLFPKC